MTADEFRDISYAVDDDGIA